MEFLVVLSVLFALVAGGRELAGSAHLARQQADSDRTELWQLQAQGWRNNPTGALYAQHSPPEVLESVAQTLPTRGAAWFGLQPWPMALKNMPLGFSDLRHLSTQGLGVPVENPNE